VGVNSGTYILDARRAGDITYALLKREPLFFSKSFQGTKA
jgi:hypothetical protein